MSTYQPAPGSDVLLTVRATVADDGAYIVRDDAGDIVFSPMPGNSYEVSVQPANTSNTGGAVPGQMAQFTVDQNVNFSDGEGSTLTGVVTRSNWGRGNNVSIRDGKGRLFVRLAREITAEASTDPSRATRPTEA